MPRGSVVPVVDSQLSLFIVALNFLPLVSLVAPGTLLCSVLLLYGSPVLQCAWGSPRFYLLGNPPLAGPWGRNPPSASFISRPFFLTCLILSSGFLSPGHSFNTHGSRASSVRGHPDPTPGSVEPATLHLAHRCLQGSTRSRYHSFSPLLRCVPGPKGPPQVKRPRSLTPGHVATSKSFHTATLSLLASLRPQSFLGASPVAQSSTTSPPVRVRLPLGHQNPNGISTPAGSLRRHPPLSSASGSPQPAALPVAAAPIPGLPPVFFWGRPYPVSQSPCASAVRDLTWAPQAPASTSAAAGEPAWCLPLFCAVCALTTSIRSTTQGRGLCRVPRPADSEVPDGQIRHPRGCHRGPHTLGPLLWSTQGLRAASTCGPARGRDPDPVPAPCVIPGPPASSGTVSVRLSRARSHLGPLAPASTSATAGEPARRLPLFCAVRAITTSARGTTQGRGLWRVLRPADSEVPDGQIRHPRGRRRGPHTLGPLPWSRPTAWTSFGPGKARF
ncbi:hypothetical protein NDU88_006458 [Pleurodeles waltl]|uniref:Uncharacterized protein n=1 Tax=Pleurodeles waltl TaxID=8319 RepID=A0AAV7NV63_PLEWA|nr:hypothetical protein NDU88_006458 [Pleurodeles waltl]